jgi:hypothetical protein
LDELTLFIEKGIPDGHEYVSPSSIKLSRNSVKPPTSLSMFAQEKSLSS